MKIIDILVKKANGTLEDGFRFKFKRKDYIYNKHQDTIMRIADDIFLGQAWAIEDILNDTVEVIEENKEIEEVENISYNFTKTSYTPIELSKNFETITELLNKQSNKINELVRAVNKLTKETEVKQ